MCLALCQQLPFATDWPTTLRRHQPPCCRNSLWPYGAVSAPVLASQPGFYVAPDCVEDTPFAPSSSALNWMISVRGNCNRLVPPGEMIPLGHRYSCTNDTRRIVISVHPAPHARTPSIVYVASPLQGRFKEVSWLSAGLLFDSSVIFELPTAGLLHARRLDLLKPLRSIFAVSVARLKGSHKAAARCVKARKCNSAGVSRGFSVIT